MGGVALASTLPVRSAFGAHAAVLGLMTFGAVGGELLLMLRTPLPYDVSASAVLLAKSARWVAIGTLAYAFFVLRHQAALTEAQLHRTELQSIEIGLQMTQARLQSLRAYIEPHFLFNTLANVRQLYRTEPDRGRMMLANFIVYLRAALPNMREEATLAQDVELAGAYLGVLQVRMGDRLTVHFDVPAETAALPFPPLALSTLAENAVKHGLNPLPEGGAIIISARVVAGKLVVDVTDTGMGFRSASGTGSGLANLRARLAALYGDAAQLDLQANAPRGIRATISIPVARRSVDAT